MPPSWSAKKDLPVSYTKGTAQIRKEAFQKGPLPLAMKGKGPSLEGKKRVSLEVVHHHAPGLGKKRRISKIVSREG